MNQTITYEAEKKQDETVSAFLMVVLEFTSEIGLFGLLERLVKVKMKQVRYSLLNKAQTVMASLVMGVATTKAINETLSDEVAAANYLWMDRFPDQSQINRYLTRFSRENVTELGEVHAQLFMQQSQARRAAGLIVVDIDQSGLVANGQTYEFKHKGPGHFPTTGSSCRARSCSRFRGWSWHLAILPSSRWATLLLEALKSRPVQLELPFACLHKT